MAFMSGSPVLSDQKFDEQRQQAQAGSGGAGTAYQPGFPGAGAVPSANYTTMTIGGTITAAVVLLILLLGAAIWGWTLVTPGAYVTTMVNGVPTQTYSVTIPPWVFLPVLGAFVLGLVTAFVPKAARITAPLYCLGYGIFLGALSSLYNTLWDGIVVQAAFATLGIFAAMLILYATRIIKVTNRFVLIVAAATFGIFLMYLFAMIASLFGVSPSFLTTPSPLAIAVSVGIIIVAALNLAIDFAFIEKASNAAVPKYMEWYAAWALTVTLIWIYLEVLRLLALLRQN